MIPQRVKRQPSPSTIRGVDIIFPAAEQAGLGCVEAAAEMGKYIIGVDSDQAMLFSGSDEAKANVILSSVLKNVGDSS